jgi:hypothetical protein
VAAGAEGEAGAAEAVAVGEAEGDTEGDAEPAGVPVADAARLEAAAEGLALALALAGDEADVGLSDGSWPPSAQAVRPRDRAAVRPATARRG